MIDPTTAADENEVRSESDLYPATAPSFPTPVIAGLYPGVQITFIDPSGNSVPANVVDVLDPNAGTVNLRAKPLNAFYDVAGVIYDSTAAKSRSWHF